MTSPSSTPDATAASGAEASAAAPKSAENTPNPSANPQSAAPAPEAVVQGESAAPDSAEVTRLDPTAARRGGEGAARRQPGAGPGRARPIGAVAASGARTGGSAAQRRSQAASVVAVVPNQEPAVVEEAPVPRRAEAGRAPIVKPINDDEYADAVPLPSKKAAAKAARRDVNANYIPGPAALPATMRQRHWGLVLYFLLAVILPATGYGWYLYAFAADQYESDAGFGSRTEDPPTTFAFLGALGGNGGSSTKDMDILNQFIGSQELVSRVNKRLDLRAIFSKPAHDPLFAFPKDGPTEDLVDYWQSMVVPNYDGGTGLMNLRVFAFDPKDAQDIAVAVLDESTAIINEMSTTAQADATKYSAETLAAAEKRLAAAQQALTDFRIKNQIVDPQSQLAGASQVVNSLVQQLGAAEIDLDMLQGTLPESDPRIAQLKRRIDVIQKRMGEESQKVGGLADTTAPGYAKLMVDYQNLQMEQDFSQKAYLAALSAYDQAVTDAQHKTRYLTTFLSPTLAESSTAPNRPIRILMALLIGFMAWSSTVMIYYALRDRR